MRLNDIILEAEGIVKYKVSIQYKDKNADFYQTREELLKYLLNSTSSAETIKLLSNLISNKFKIPKVDTNKLFYDLKSLNIINPRVEWRDGSLFNNPG